MSNRNDTCFRYAEQISYLSDCRVRIGAVLVIGTHICASGFNHVYKTSRIQHSYSYLRGFDADKNLPTVHAKISLLSKIRHLDLNLRKARVYVFRRDRNGNLADCKPCPACHQALKDFGIRTVFYTSKGGYNKCSL